MLPKCRAVVAMKKGASIGEFIDTVKIDFSVHQNDEKMLV